MKIRRRILIQTLGASLALIAVLGVVFFISVIGIRKTVLANSYELGDSAAGISANAMEDQLTKRIDRIAKDATLVLNERLNKIENQTRMTADIIGSIYTNRQGWSAKPLPLVLSDDVTPGEPYLYIIPGVDFSRVRGEAELVGNIKEMLRQITVVDRGIITSTVSGETGYVLAMDAYPWPMADYDPRVFDWYTAAKEAEGLCWTDVYLDHRGRGPAITCAVPFYEEVGRGRIFRGVTRSAVLLADFSRLIDFSAAGETGRLFLLNRSGMVIYSSNGVEVTFGEAGKIEGEKFLESSDPRLRSLGLSMTLGAFGMTELEMDGVPVYIAYAPVETLGWSLAVAVPVQAISASALLIENQIWRITNDTRSGMDRRILFSAGLIASLLLLTLGGITFFAVRFTGSITGPILALNDGVREVSGGNLDREVVVRTGDELEQLSTSFNMMTSRLRNYIEEIARATAEKQRIDTELYIATNIQMSMLPMDFPPFPGRKDEFDLYAQMYPAKEVGGDFYDFFFANDDHFFVIIADVSGKGIPAALFMANTKTIIKDHLSSGEDPRQALNYINRQLCGSNITDMFVTLWLGMLEISTGRLRYINAGHNPPLIRQDGLTGFTFLVSPPDLVLAGMDETVYHQREIVLSAGDTLFLYTDGITEAVDEEGVFYGKERLKRFLDVNAALPLSQMLPRLRTDLTDFTGAAEQWDDMTMLALRMEGSGGGKPLPRIILKTEIAELENLHAFIGRELETSGCPQRIRNQIELASEEIFVNIINYAYEGQGELTVDCYISPSLQGYPPPVGEEMSMILVFTDHGCPFDPTEIAEPDISLPMEERQEGGVGLLIVKKSIDTINYSRENGTNRLELVKSWQKEKK